LTTIAGERGARIQVRRGYGGGKQKNDPNLDLPVKISQMKLGNL